MNHRGKVLREKIYRVATLLEQLLGIPNLPRRPPHPLDMLIATVLSQHTNDRNSHRAYVRLRQKYPTWENVLDAPLQGISSAIRPGGMAQQKSMHIKKILSALRMRYGGLDLRFLKKKTDEEIFEILLSLDGVGVKTASCVLLFSLRRDVFPVDTHIHRICGRLGLAPKYKTPEKTFAWMKGNIPDGKAYSFHTNLIRFGRKTCRATNPLCGACGLYKICLFQEKNKFRASMQTRTLAKNYDFMLLDHV